MYVQWLTIAIVFELIYYTNGHFYGMTDIHKDIQNAMPTFYINQFFMGYISYFFHKGKIKIHLVIQSYWNWLIYSI